MSEDKKLNRLNLNKETIADLDVPPDQEVVGGSASPAACIPQTLDSRQCYTKGPAWCPGPIAAPPRSAYC